MTDTDSPPRVLVPFAVLDGQTVPPGVVDLLADVHTVLLGYYEVPDQTAPGQARMQFADRAEQLIDDVADGFREAGASVESRLVFTPDYEKTVDRVARETGCTATLVVQPAPEVEDVYVALGDPDEADPVGRVLAGVLGDLDVGVSVRYFLDGADPGAGETALETVADSLAAAGLDRGAIDTDVREGAKTVGAIVEDAGDVDVVVIADPDLSLGEFILGDIEERVAGHLLAPVLVIRKETPKAAGDADDPGAGETTSVSEGTDDEKR